MNKFIEFRIVCCRLSLRILHLCKVFIRKLNIVYSTIRNEYMCKINYKSSTIYRTILKPTEIQIVLNDIGNVL